MNHPPETPPAPRVPFRARLETTVQDLRYTLRGLRRSPGFTATVVLTLGLGIGANAAMFGILDRLMFRPYPYLRDQGSVHRVYLQSTYRERRSTEDVSIFTRYLDLRNNTTSFSQYAGFTSRTFAVGLGDGARERPVGVVSASFFDFFDAQPARGRFFVASQDSVPRGEDVAVLSYEFWQSEFGGRDVLNETLQVNNIRCVIIGVAPKGFVGMFDANPPALYIPITTFAGSVPQRGDRENYYKTYNWGWMEMMVRRKPGITIDVASSDLTQAYITSWNTESSLNTSGNTPLETARPQAIAGPLKQAAGPDPSVEARTLAWVGGIAIIVLLIACSNVANLFLARSLKRRRETAVRLALGVARTRLMAQWFTESLVLALIGCGAGVLIAQWGGAAMRQIFVGRGAPIPVATDWRTLGVAAALAIVAAVLTGLAPALLADRGNLAGSLKAGAREGTYQRSHLRSGLLVLQVTLSVILLVGAGLFVKSFANVRAMRLGYDVDPVVLVSRNLRGMQLNDTINIALGKRLLETAQAIPGVEHAAWVSSVPFSSTSSTRLLVEGIDTTEKLGRFTYQTSTPGYFAAMNTRILRGRAFTDADHETAPKVAVISEAMAGVLWPGKDAIGQCLKVGGSTSAPCTTVIGIAEDAFQSNLTDDSRFRYYLPISQYGSSRGYALLTRVRGDPAVMGETLRKALQQVMPGESYVTTRPLRELISDRQRAWRLGATMFGAFGVLALVVAAIGLYGVIGYNVAQRMPDFGVRAALGAQSGDLLRLVLSQGVKVTLIGIAVGVTVALAVGKQIQPLLFKQEARDPIVFGIVALALLIAAIAASVAPARRAAKADPILALRAE